jgi:hypothetical protein
VATYTVRVGAGPTTALSASSPSISVTLLLTPTTVVPPGEATLVLADSHPGPKLLPGLWYVVPITATGGLTLTTSVRLLVGGARAYLPAVLRE